MMNRVKAARLRPKGSRGSVAIEAALFFIVAAALLTAFISYGSQVYEYYQINAMTDHVGQIIARSDTISSSSVQAVLDDAIASNSTFLTGETLCVVVTWSDNTTLSVPSACSCSVEKNSYTLSMGSSFVVVNGCTKNNFQSSSIFPTLATFGSN